MDLKEKVKKLPSCSGVYLMKDCLNSVIYVGKSKNLKNRVRSYFQNSKSHSPKVIKLVKNLKDFDYIVTDTEFEAFMLECKLIKEIKPIYNKQMKSPKSYCYIKVKINEKFPDIEICNESSKNDKNLYFGPYTNKSVVERGIQGLKEYYKILCNNNSRKGEFCINYSLGLCIGMCFDNDSKRHYNAIFNKIVKLLNGTDKSIIEALNYSMNTASENFDFEIAAKYRDYLSAVRYILDKAKVVKYTEENKNIVLIEHLTDNKIKFFLIKGNKVLFSDNYLLTNSKKLKSILKPKILFYFTDKAQKNSIKIKKEEIDESQIIYTYLKNKSNNCRYVIIPKEWIDNSTGINIDKSLNELLF